MVQGAAAVDAARAHRPRQGSPRHPRLLQGHLRRPHQPPGQHRRQPLQARVAAPREAPRRSPAAGGYRCCGWGRGRGHGLERRLRSLVMITSHPGNGEMNGTLRVTYIPLGRCLAPCQRYEKQAFDHCHLFFFERVKRYKPCRYQ